MQEEDEEGEAQPASEEVKQPDKAKTAAQDTLASEENATEEKTADEKEEQSQQDESQKLMARAQELMRKAQAMNQNTGNDGGGGSNLTETPEEEMEQALKLERKRLDAHARYMRYYRNIRRWCLSF